MANKIIVRVGSKMFRIHRFLSRTIFGTVWAGVSCNAQSNDKKIEPVALKFSTRTNAIKSLESPKDEIIAMQALGCMDPNACHPNILNCIACSVEESKSEDKVVYAIVLEYARGGDLIGHTLSGIGFCPNKKLGLEWDLPREDAVKKVIRDVLQAVQSMHESGYAHLDISMENVLMIGNKCKICDFGMAQELPLGNRVALDHLPGKDPYRAPEANIKGSEFDATLADVYSVGTMTFMLLTGEYAYTSPDKSDKNFLKMKLGREGIQMILEDLGKMLSNKAADFIAKLTLPELERWNIAQAMLHPFLEDE